MKKTGIFKPYTPAGECTLKTTGSGCYFIRKAGKIVYIGFSGTDVKKTMYRHLQKWKDKRHPENRRAFFYDRVTYDRDAVTLQVVFTKTSKEAAALEQILILKYKPQDNASKLDLFSAGVKRDILNKYESAVTHKASDEELPF